MLLTDIPTKFALPFGNNAGGPYIRTIPTLSQVGIQNGAASLFDGFPPLCFTPIGAGGVPPFGQDFNGIHFQETAWLRWMAAGGSVPFFDQTFATAVGGYPNRAFLQSQSGPGNFWISSIDNNTNDPDAAGAGWTAFPGPGLVYPSATQTTNAVFNFNCQTMYSLGLSRSAPAAMTANLAAVGALVINQKFEVADLSGNLSAGPVSVFPPATHLIAGSDRFIMNRDRQKCTFKYYGSATGTGLWDVEGA